MKELKPVSEMEEKELKSCCKAFDKKIAALQSELNKLREQAAPYFEKRAEIEHKAMLAKIMATPSALAAAQQVLADKEAARKAKKEAKKAAKEAEKAAEATAE